MLIMIFAVLLSPAASPLADFGLSTKPVSVGLEIKDQRHDFVLGRFCPQMHVLGLRNTPRVVLAFPPDSVAIARRWDARRLHLQIVKARRWHDDRQFTRKFRGHDEPDFLTVRGEREIPDLGHIVSGHTVRLSTSDR
jgi:hypothetical protein